MNFNQKVLISLFMLAFSTASLADVSTTIEIDNTTSSDETLISGDNVTGSITPAVPSTLDANSSTTHISSTPGTLADAGVIEYQSCRFNWSSINIGSIYIFSKEATDVV